LSFNSTSHILTIASATNTYWHKGEKYTTTAAITCDLNDFITPTTNKLYYVYFDDYTGTLKASESVWDLKEKVPVATIFWNGSIGAVQRESHNHTCDLDWHINAHLTIGARYFNGLDLTKPTTSSDASLDITSGNIYDEDLLFIITNPTNCRIVYAASSGVYTFVNSNYPFAGIAADKPRWLDTDDYTLKEIDSNYVCSWVYATGDIERPIYIVPTHAKNTHNTVSNARNEKIPTLAGFNLNPEMKLIYRFIYNSSGEFQEATDYRTVSSLPAGAIASTAASAVTFAPHGTVAATNVQAAIEELVDEKSETTHVHTEATTSAAGFVLAATAPASGLVNVVGIVNGETAYTNKALFAATNPTTQAYSDSASAGTATTTARIDHKHGMPAIYTHPSHTGDVTGSAGLTIADAAVTNAKLAHVATATIKGRITADTGDVEDLTVAQVTTLLNITAAAVTGEWGWL